MNFYQTVLTQTEKKLIEQFWLINATIKVEINIGF